VGHTQRAPGEWGLTSDLQTANANARAARDIEAFEQRLTPELRDGFDSDSDDEREDGARKSAATRADLLWSDEAPELDRLAQDKRTRAFGKLETVQEFLRTLRLRSCGIATLDSAMQHMANLCELDVSGNALQTLENLPPRMLSLQAYDNRICRVRASTWGCAATIEHLGLGFNQLKTLEAWVNHLPSLVSLDVGFNELGDLDAALDRLKGLPALRHLRLEGNPFCLVPGYRERALAALPALESLDGLKPQDGRQDTAASDRDLAVVEVSIQVSNLEYCEHVPVLAAVCASESEGDGDAGAAVAESSPETVDAHGLPQHHRFTLRVDACLPGEAWHPVGHALVCLDDPIAAEEAAEEGDGSPAEDAALRSGERQVRKEVSMAATIAAGRRFELAPDVATRNALEDGLPLRLVWVDEAVCGDAPDSEADPDGKADASEEDVAASGVGDEVLSTEETVLAVGYLELSGVFAAEADGRLSVPEAVVQFEALRPPPEGCRVRGDGVAVRLTAAVNPRSQPSDDEESSAADASA